MRTRLGRWWSRGEKVDGGRVEDRLCRLSNTTLSFPCWLDAHRPMRRKINFGWLDRFSRFVVGLFRPRTDQPRLMLRLKLRPKLRCNGATSEPRPKKRGQNILYRRGQQRHTHSARAEKRATTEQQTTFWRCFSALLSPRSCCCCCCFGASITNGVVTVRCVCVCVCVNPCRRASLNKASFPVVDTCLSQSSPLEDHSVLFRDTLIC